MKGVPTLYMMKYMVYIVFLLIYATKKMIYSYTFYLQGKDLEQYQPIYIQ